MNCDRRHRRSPRNRSCHRTLDAAPYAYLDVRQVRLSDEIDVATLPLEPDSKAAEPVERFPDLRAATLVVAVRLMAQATLQHGI